MTIDKAIEHAKEVAKTCGDSECAAEHAQLAEWLATLKVYTDTHMADEVKRARHEMHGWQLEWKREMERGKWLKAENERLESRLTRYMADAEIWHAQWVAEYESNARLKRENKKLRTLVDAWMGCGTRYHTMSGACPMFDKDAEDFCKASQMARELGIEVSE